LKFHLFAKSFSISRNNGDEFLQLIRCVCQENESTYFDWPCSWKTVSRTIAEQTNFYNRHKMTIEFPSDWKMDKCNFKNGPLPEKLLFE